MWTSQQRGVLLGVVVLLLGFLTWRYLRNLVYIGNPLPAVAPQGAQLADRLDPNAASAAELSALPLLGEKRAGDIVAYREQFLRDHPDDIPFMHEDDLKQVKGIGPATVEKLRPFLLFPADTPATQP